MNANETAEFILQFALKLMKEKKPSFYLAPAIEEPVYSAMLTKRIKKENVTPQNIGEVMLSQIPFVSNTVAVAVMQHYKTLNNLLAALAERTTALNSIYVETKNGLKKKINKTCISNIYSYLLPTVSPASDALLSVSSPALSSLSVLEDPTVAEQETE